jgi:manganese/iron transport system permease protein
MDLLLAPLELEFMQRALAAVVVVGAVCGVLGAFVVLRGLAFMGDALAHAIFPGVVVAYLLKGSLVVGGVLFGLLTALGIGLVARSRRVAEDTAIGILFAGAFALGVVLISTTRSYTRDLTSFLFGNILGVGPADLALIAAVALFVLAVVALLEKELVLISFDREVAEAMGYPVFRLDVLLLVLIALTIVVALQAVGNVLVMALLVTPSRLRPMMALGALIGGLSGLVGLYLSYYFDLAAGATIVLVATATFFVAMGLSALRQPARRAA